MLGLDALIDGVEYKARRWSKKRMEHVWERVRAGPSCMKTLRALRLVWAGGLDGPTDPYEEMRHGAEAKARGQTCGSVTWQAKL